MLRKALDFENGMKVFISYSTALDQIIALRLQTMAAVYGMTVYVPPATTRYGVAPALLPEVQKQLDESNVVLAIITHKPVPSAMTEMNAASMSGTLLIPIVSWTVPREYYVGFQQYFVVDPNDPSLAEREIVYFLEQKQAEQGQGTAKFALIALATLAVGLLLFGSDSE